MGLRGFIDYSSPTVSARSPDSSYFAFELCYTCQSTHCGMVAHYGCAGYRSKSGAKRAKFQCNSCKPSKSFIPASTSTSTLSQTGGQGPCQHHYSLVSYCRNRKPQKAPHCGRTVRPQRPGCHRYPSVLRGSFGVGFQHLSYAAG